MITDSKIINSLSSELVSGETFLWVGQPKQGVLWNPLSITLVVANSIWILFAIYFIINSLSSNEKALNEISAIGFGLLSGLFLNINHFYLNPQKRSKIFYGTTEHRIIIVQNSSTKKNNSYFFKTLNEIMIVRESNDLGTIVFTQGDHKIPDKPDDTGEYIVQFLPKLELLKEYNRVYHLILALKK